jgi:hypothetical protein
MDEDPTFVKTAHNAGKGIRKTGTFVLIDTKLHKVYKAMILGRED